jgi:hypothetical protein
MSRVSCCLRVSPLRDVVVKSMLGLFMTVFKFRFFFRGLQPQISSGE